MLWAQVWGCPSCWSGASPAIQKWTGAALWLHVGPVRLQQDIQAQLLSWGPAGGQADDMRLGARPWRLEGVLGEGFQLTGRSVSVGVGPSRPGVFLGSEVGGAVSSTFPPVCSPAQPLPAPPPTASRETPGLS